MSHRMTLEVRFSEVDMMQVVYHTNYINYMEIARSKLYVEHGFSLDTTQERGYVYPVKDIQITYHTPAKYRDILTIETKVIKQTRAKTVYHQFIYGEHNVLHVDAVITIVCVDHHTFQLVRMDRALPDVYEVYANLVEN